MARKQPAEAPPAKTARPPKGVCTQCGQPAVPFPTGPRKGHMSSRCQKHQDYKKARRQARRRQGLCIICGQPAVRHEDGPRAGQFFPHCLPHLISIREYMRQRAGATRRQDAASYRAQRAAGLETPGLPSPSPQPGLSQQRIRERRAQRLCVHCGQPAFIHLHGKRQGQAYDLCLAHMAQRREAYRAARGHTQRHRSASYAASPDGPQPSSSRSGRKWAELRAAGLCVHCGQPAARRVSGKRAGECFIHCLEHLIQSREADRRRAGATGRKNSPSYQAQQAAGLPLPPLPTPSCGPDGKQIPRPNRRKLGLCRRCNQPALLRPWGKRQGQPSSLCLHHTQLLQQAREAKNPGQRFRYTLAQAYAQAAPGEMPSGPLDRDAERHRQGQCVQCGQPAQVHLSGKKRGQPATLCLQHLVERRESGRLQSGAIRRTRSLSYEAEIAAGLASPDRLPPPPQAKSHGERRQQGLCVRCRQPALVHLWGQRKGQPAAHCAQHLAERREYIRQLYGCEKRVKSLSYLTDPSTPPDSFWRQGRTDEELLRAGLCRRCGQPTPVHESGKRQGQHYILCPQHNAESLAYQKRHFARLRAADETAAQPSGPDSPPAEPSMAAPGDAAPGQPRPSLRAQGLCWMCKQPAGLRLTGLRKGQPYIYCPKHRAKKAAYVLKRTQPRPSSP